MRRYYLMIVGLLFIGVSVSSGLENSRLQQAREAHARWQQNGTATLEEKALMEAELFGGAGQLRGDALDEFGGPDPLGYRWVDNQAPDTTVYDWVELCGDPDAQFGPTGDDNAAQISWAFAFPFYGVSYSSAYVSTNGRIDFAAADASWWNRCASVDAVDPVINVFWDDMAAQQTQDCGAGTPRIKYRDFGDRLVIEWKDVWHYPYSYPDQRASFEAVLFADGRIKMQYDTVNFATYENSATVGIDVPGPGGLEYVCNGAPANHQFASDRAVWFYPTVCCAPETPQQLTVKVSGNDLLLFWRVAPTAQSYHVYSSTSPNVDPIPANQIAVTQDTTLTITNALSDPSALRCYTVTAATP